MNKSADRVTSQERVCGFYPRLNCKIVSLFYTNCPWSPKINWHHFPGMVYMLCLLCDTFLPVLLVLVRITLLNWCLGLSPQTLWCDRVGNHRKCRRLIFFSLFMYFLPLKLYIRTQREWNAGREKQERLNCQSKLL